jgi:hypothetical protein
VSPSKFERVIEEILTTTKKKFITQKVLVKKQKQIHGRAIATPDFYFEKGITLPGIDEKIFWIDATLSPHTEKKSEQRDKYINHFGHGLIVYLKGHSHHPGDISYEDFLEKCILKWGEAVH